MSQRYIGGLIYNPPGGFSGYFDGSGDFLTWTGTAAGSGAFCYEFWIFSQNGFATMRAPLGVIATSGYNSALDIRMTGSTINVSQYNVANNNFTVDPLQANTWYHIAVCRNASNQTTVFVNGVRSSTGAVTLATNFSGLTSAIGRLDPSNGGDVTGYISNVRLITGSTPYDPTQTTITVPSGPLQAITGTQFLSCAYPTFRDGSSNNFTITVNGNTAVSTQNPFPLTQLPNPALGNQGNGVYSMSQYQALRSQNLWPAIDQYWPYVTMMLHGNGTNGAQNNTFLDSSTNNFTITRNGNTTQGTFTPYGSLWSNYTAGSSGGASRVDVSGASGIFGTNISYTMEGWFMFTTNSAGDAPNIITINTNTYPNRWLWDAGLSGGTLTLRLYTESNAVVFNSTATPYTLGTWVHLAVVNDNAANTCTFYMNGVAIGSRAKVSLTAASTLNLLCNSTSVSSAMPFYVSNFRIVNNVALYTSNFTPSTSPLTAVSGTALLAFQSNRFIDTSGSNLTLTVNGTNQIQRFSPFAPTTPYAADVIGGSGYFDGTGDFLNTPSTGQFAPSGDFTISCWYYPTSTRAYQQIIGNYNGSASTVWIIEITSGTGINFYTNGTTSRISGSGIVVNAWNYLVLARSGSTITGYVNGVSVGTYSQSGTFGSATQAISIGRGGSTTGSGDFGLGYIADVKLIDGSAITTVPTAPQTATSGTSLLLNMTNGGIIDNAMMNDLETVGNAQISTSVSKFGGGSIAFDGTGDGLVPNAPIGATAFGTGDFTIEFWAYITNTGATQATIVDSRAFGVTSTTNQIYIIYTSANNISFFTNGAYRINSSAITQNTWNHVALVRASGSTKMYLNGVQTGSTYTDTNNYAGNPNRPAIGVDATDLSSFGFPGNIDDLRITKGYARYTANFTPQRSQWQDQ